MTSFSETKLLNEKDADPIWEQINQAFAQYLNSQEMQAKIMTAIKSTNKSYARINISLDSLRKNSKDLVNPLLKNPIKCLRYLHTSLSQVLNFLEEENSDGKKKNQSNLMPKHKHYEFGFEGNFGNHCITPRGLSSLNLHCLVAVSGIVTRMSLVRPKLVHSVHYCDATKVGRVKEYYDQYNIVTDVSSSISSNAYPTKDENNNPLVTEYGFCNYRDHQTLTLQEMPEKAPAGLLPFSVEVILEGDLIDKVKPGDRVQIVGVYKSITTQSTSLNAIFKTVLIATNITMISSGIQGVILKPSDTSIIKNVAARPDVFDLLSRSIAPSIFGHEYIKKAILLMLLGGVERNLESKTHLRGDINILMVGDPSTAKSQLLRRILSIAPLAINTTGRGSSGVGLTAAVVYDKESGDRHLEAGAMVLADKGIVCIDEFDKMEEADRVAIHEVMEQQTVTIAKAGIHTSLNARCSVIAAANPIYGEYQKDLPPTKNIGLPDSLLSRFDFLFIVLDEKNPETDRLIAERVTRNHRYMKTDHEDHFGFENDGDPIVEPEINEDVDDDGEDIAEDPFEKFNNIIHDSTQQELVTLKFLKKYLQYAKTLISPILKDEAIDYISAAWTQLRQRDIENTMSNQPKIMTITIRTLETLIRIATAHARLRLSRHVEAIDCEIAMELMSFALFGEKPNENEDKDENQDNNNDDDNNDVKKDGMSKSNNRSQRNQNKDQMMEESDKKEDMSTKNDTKYMLGGGSLKKKIQIKRQQERESKNLAKKTEINEEDNDYINRIEEEEQDIQEITYNKGSIKKITPKRSINQDYHSNVKSPSIKTRSTATEKQIIIKDDDNSSSPNKVKAGSKQEISTDSNKLTKQLKKVKLNEEDQLQELLNDIITSNLSVSEEAIKYVFVEFNGLLKGGRTSITELELFEHIKNNKNKISDDCLKSIEGLRQVIDVLDKKGKLMYNKRNKTIIGL